MTLKKYNKKRNFKITPEPKGKKVKKGRHSLYLIQKHAAKHLHYDLRLELNGTLKSWAVPKGPSLDPTVKRLAVHVEDHPVSYGSFEGIIPAGEYGGGTVMLWDTGQWECVEPNPLAAYKKGSLKFILKGKKLKGLWKLIQIKSDPKNWLLIKAEDKYSRSSEEYDITEKKANSVKSKRSLEGIAKHFNVDTTVSETHKKKKLKKIQMPSSIAPELATLIEEAPNGKEWLHEIKFDGYRIICLIKSGKVKLITRNQNDWTSKFPSIANNILKFARENTIFDGELVALNEKQHSDFQTLQNAIHAHDTSQLVYYVFDLLYYNGMDLTETPLLERKNILHKLIKKTVGTIRYSDHVVGSGKALFKKSCKLGLEGIISKKINSLYLQKRSTDWLKSKCIKRQEFIVVGFTKPGGRRVGFGSLLLAVYNKDKQLQYAGHVGTGFNDLSLNQIKGVLSKYIMKNFPFSPMPAKLGKVTWVKPKMVVEVEFTEWTKDGLLRHPSFKGMRKDKSPREIKLEKPRKKS